ncbi:uncharacterized protein V1518DRAFT_416160 [Limtongia smithiae]|uniref:uncharacterized protein n=1 Tax=Limtongia smithiae TaxID=1125753 RepID=UPI0034CD32E6
MPASPRPKVLIVSEISEENPVYIEEFSRHFECIHYRPTSIAQFEADLTKPEYADIAGVWAMWLGFAEFGPGKLSPRVLNALPPTVKVFAIATIGYDHYDVDAFTKRGIVFTHNRGIGSLQVADIALFLLLATFRFTSALEHHLRTRGSLPLARGDARVEVFDHSVANRNAVAAATPRLAYEFGDRVGGRPVESPYGRRCGIVGMGAIGKEVVRRVIGLGMSVHFYTRTPLAHIVLEKLPMHAVTVYSSLEELLPNCDVIVLCLPLTPQSKHMLNDDTLAKLPAGARVVNVGRGGLIDTDALVRALDSGHISAAGLDVYESEPELPSSLRERWDVTLLPHIGSATIETVEMAEIGVMRNIENVLLQHGKGITPLNDLS